MQLFAAAVQDLSSSSSCFCSHLKTELFSRTYGVNSPQHAHNSLAIRMGERKIIILHIYIIYKTTVQLTYKHTLMRGTYFVNMINNKIS